MENALEGCRRRWEDNIKMDLEVVGWKHVEWLHLVQDRGKLCALVNTLMNLHVS